MGVMVVGIGIDTTLEKKLWNWLVKLFPHKIYGEEFDNQIEWVKIIIKTWKKNMKWTTKSFFSSQNSHSSDDVSIGIRRRIL